MKIYLSRRAGRALNINIYAETAKRFLLCAVAVLCLCCVAVGSVCLYLELQFVRYTAEVGQLVTAADITGDENAYFTDGETPDRFSNVGIYKVKVSTNDKDVTVRLKVRDTKAPEITVKDVYFAVGAPIPSPEEYIDTVFEPSDFFGEYLTDVPELTKIGSHSMQVRFTDAHGNKTQVFSVKMTQIYDSTPPVIQVPERIIATLDTPIDYSQYITLSDNCTGELTYTVDDSALDLTKEDEYEITVTAADAVGNRSKLKITVEVIEKLSESETENG